MKTQSLIRLICLVLIVAAAAFWIFCGCTIGTVSFKAWGPVLKTGIETGEHTVAVFNVTDGNEDGAVNMENAVAVLKARIEKCGYEAYVTRQENSVRVEAATSSIYTADMNRYITLYGLGTTVGSVIVTDTDGNTILTNANIKSSKFLGYDSSSSSYIVRVKTDKAGTAAIKDATSNGTYTLKATMDKSTTITSSLTGTDKITNGTLDLKFSTSDAIVFAQVADCGALEDTVKLGQSYTAEASYGDRTLTVLAIAAGVMLILLMAYLIVSYRFSGVAAAMSMLIGTLAFSFFMATFDSTVLDMGGVAGVGVFILMLFAMNLLGVRAFTQSYASGTDFSGAQDSFKNVILVQMDITVAAILAGILLCIIAPAFAAHFGIAVIGGAVVAFLSAVLLPKHYIRLLNGCGVAEKSFVRKEGASNEK